MSQGLLPTPKHERVEALIRAHGSAGGDQACYDLFFALFNAGDYYEAHDVLEHLWLARNDANSIFYKGLIQIAGGFVHLRRQFLRPAHPKDGKKLAPASRLLLLGASNIRGFGPRHMGLDVTKLCALCEKLAREIEESGFQINPWSPQTRTLVFLK
ncbi:MAG: DUF309 domain-containing protein [Verrucomicrobiota bacterium]